MRTVLMILATTFFFGCGSYKGNEIWRRSACEEIVDVDERARCLEEAARPESEYQRDVEDASGK